MSKQKMMTLSALAAMCVLASLSMHAKAAEQEAQKAQKAGDRQEGMVVTRDAETGKLRAPTPEELRELRAKAPRAPSALTATPQQPRETIKRDGSRNVLLGEKSMVYEVVTRDADGKLSSQCVQGDGAARAAVSQPADASHKEHSHEEHTHDAR
jgi:hypothetical protein